MTTDSSNTCETPMRDHVDRACRYMAEGWRMTLDRPDGFATAVMGSDVAEEIASRLDAFTAMKEALEGLLDAATGVAGHADPNDEEAQEAFADLNEARATANAALRLASGEEQRDHV